MGRQHSHQHAIAAGDLEPNAILPVGAVEVGQELPDVPLELLQQVPHSGLLLVDVMSAPDALHNLYPVSGPYRRRGIRQILINLCILK